MRDFDYIEQRNKYIPIAMKIAQQRVAETGITSKRVKGKDGQYFNWSFETQYYCEEMEKFAQEELYNK